MGGEIDRDPGGAQGNQQRQNTFDGLKDLLAQLVLLLGGAGHCGLGE